MDLGILGAIVSVPGIIGTTEGVRHTQSANKNEAIRGRKINLRIKLPQKNCYSEKFDSALIVLKDDKLYIQHSNSDFPPGSTHPFLGCYYPYPDNLVRWKTAGWKGEGLVSTIPPLDLIKCTNTNDNLNATALRSNDDDDDSEEGEEEEDLCWVYVCSKTHQVKYALQPLARSEAEAEAQAQAGETEAKAEGGEYIFGPWDLTFLEKRVTFEGWEGFLAVQESESEDLWSLYFDRDDDGLSRFGLIGHPKGKEQVRMLEVLLYKSEPDKEKEMADEERERRLYAMKEKV